MKTDFTAIGKRTWKGSLKDEYNGIKRFFLGNFYDNRDQVHFNLWLRILLILVWVNWSQKRANKCVTDTGSFHDVLNCDCVVGDSVCSELPSGPVLPAVARGGGDEAGKHMADKVRSEFVGDFGDGQDVPAVQHSSGEKAHPRA
jgi:hypothetical protein